MGPEGYQPNPDEINFRAARPDLPVIAPLGLDQAEADSEDQLVKVEKFKSLERESLISAREQTLLKEYHKLSLQDLLEENKLDEYRNLLLLYEKGIFRDSLTGLPNRNALIRQAEVEKERREKGENDTTIVLFMDVNNFGTLNRHEAFGPAWGDSVLEYMGQTLDATIRGEDVAFRYAGDEFVIVARVDAEEKKSIAERVYNSININQFIAEKIDLERNGSEEQWEARKNAVTEFSVGVSIGIADFGGDFTQSLSMADAALLEAKKNKGTESPTIAYFGDMTDAANAELGQELPESSSPETLFDRTGLSADDIARFETLRHANAEDISEEMWQAAPALVRSLGKAYYVDASTGLPNRNSLKAIIDQSNEPMENKAQFSGAFYLTIEGLKYVNDMYGHDKGNEMIQKFGEVLNRLRQSDPRFDPARYSGNEFVVLLRQVEDLNELRQKLEEAFQGEAISLPGSESDTSVWPIRFMGTGVNIDNRGIVQALERAHSDFKILDAERRNGDTIDKFRIVNEPITAERSQEFAAA